MEHIEPNFTAPADTMPTTGADARGRVQHTRGTLEVTLQAASRLVERRRTDPWAAHAEVVRALLDRFGDPATPLLDGEAIDVIAARAIGIAQREVAIAGATEQLAATNNASMFDATLAVANRLDRTYSFAPYDSSTPEGREMQRRWLTVAAWEAKARAQRSRADAGEPA